MVKRLLAANPKRYPQLLIAGTRRLAFCFKSNLIVLLLLFCIWRSGDPGALWHPNDINLWLQSSSFAEIARNDRTRDATTPQTQLSRFTFTSHDVLWLTNGATQRGHLLRSLYLCVRVCEWRERGWGGGAVGDEAATIVNRRNEPDVWLSL